MVAYKLANQYIFAMTSERNELGVPNCAGLYWNKLTMFSPSFIKFHSVLQKVLAVKFGLQKYHPTKLASAVKNRFLAKLFNKLFYAYIRLLFVTTWIRTPLTQLNSTVESTFFSSSYSEIMSEIAVHCFFLIHTDILSILWLYLLTPFL